MTVVDDDDFAPEERARLDAALERSVEQTRSGQLVDGDTVTQKLRARR